MPNLTSRPRARGVLAAMSVVAAHIRPVRRRIAAGPRIRDSSTTTAVTSSPTPTCRATPNGSSHAGRRRAARHRVIARSQRG
jgi:hypothetical protein